MVKVRETDEEAGCNVELTGILRIERSLKHDHARMRVIYHARPINADAPLKLIPDQESISARWVDLNELHSIANGIDPRATEQKDATKIVKLRGKEPMEWFTYLERGGSIAPMSAFKCTRSGRITEIVITPEGYRPRGLYPTQFYVRLLITDDEGKYVSWRTTAGWFVCRSSYIQNMHIS